MDWTAILPTLVVSLILGVGAVLLRTMMRGLKTYLDDEIKSKLVPNGGQSIADRLTKVEKAVNELAHQYEEHGCQNPDCPERYTCQHMPPPRRRRPRGRYG